MNYKNMYFIFHIILTVRDEIQVHFALNHKKSHMLKVICETFSFGRGRIWIYFQKIFLMAKISHWDSQSPPQSHDICLLCSKCLLLTVKVANVWPFLRMNAKILQCAGIICFYCFYSVNIYIYIYIYYFYKITNSE